MKIAFLTSEFPHPETGTSGGIGTSIKNLAAGLSAEGVVVSVLVYGQASDSVLTDGNVTIYRIKNVKIKGLSWYFTRKKIQRIINKLYREKKIDLVEAADWTGITSFINSKCPIVVKLHGSDTYFCHLDNRPVKWINRFHEKRALQKADALLSVSKYTADMTNQLFGLKRAFTIIPNGVDTRNFESATSLSSNTILYFGTLIRKKGLLELPYIFNAVHEKDSNAQLLLIGKDSPDIVSGNASTWKMMQSLFTDGALSNVSYLGSVDYNKIKNFIQDATVCVFPTFAEALPVSWIEAMAMAKPIVASNIGWATEIIDDSKNGFLLHPKNHGEFASRIAEILENDSLQKMLGQAARETAISRFDIKVVAQQHIAFYKSQIL